MQVTREIPTDSLAREWERLADDLVASAFMHPGWVLAWTRAFSSGPLTLLCARRDGELAGVLPFVERSGIRRSPTNWHTPEFGLLARDPEARTALAAAFVDHPGAGIDVCFLDRGDDALSACVEAAETRRRRIVVRTVQRSPYVDLAGGDWNAYRASLPAKTRKELRRLRRRLEEQGSVKFEFAGGTADVEALLAEGFAVEGSGWKDTGGTAIASEVRTQRFYGEIARWAASRDELLLAFLRLDGRPIAFDFCLESRGRTYALKGGFDPAFRRYGPGMLLTFESLRRASEHGCSSYELLGDADRYKLVWTRDVRERVRLQAFRLGSPAGAVRWVAWSYGRPMVRSLQAALGVAP